MDTIEIGLMLVGCLGVDLVQSLIKDVNSLLSPYGYTFCTVLEFSKTGNLIIKISYPRFFSGSNAFLIDRRSQCFEVQKYFAEAIMGMNIGKIK